MNTTVRFASFVALMLALGSPAFADPLGIADSVSIARGHSGSPAVGSGEENQLTFPVVGANLDSIDFFLMEEPIRFIDALLFPGGAGATKAASSARIVPEPSTWLLLLLAIGILVATRQTVPINLRTMHSRLQVKRGHAPTR